MTQLPAMLNDHNYPDLTESALKEKSETGPEFSRKMVVLSNPNSVDAENFKILRARILLAKKRKRPKLIMVTSAFPGEGKTYVAANLAVSIAMGIDEYVLLVDCDLRRASLHGMLGYTNREGLHEYLIGENKLSDLIINTNIAKLSMLTTGRAPHNPTELLSSSLMERFLEEIRDRYDDRFIIIDSTPSHFTSEAHILAKHVDGIIFVVMANKTPRKEIQKAIEDLGKDKIIGLVFNGDSKVRNSYRKFYQKYYNQKLRT